MHLKKLNLVNFKNYSDAALEFSPAVNCFFGKNGSGKTNLLDAIHYLSLCKSYFNPIDVQQIKHEEAFFVIQGFFERKDNEESVYCGLKRHQKKQFKRNGKEYARLAEHIGLFPVVIITPFDTLLIMEGSEERRKFLDSVISQTNPEYLDDLLSYNKVLFNRNALLKSFGEQGRVDREMLDVYDEQLIAFGTRIYKKRKEFIEEISPVFQQHFNFISDGEEKVGMVYETQLDKMDFAEGLRSHEQRDMAFQRSTFGPHKDDISFTIHGEYPLKKLGSQGQQKTYLIALKLAQYSYLDKYKGFKPLLLLDDIFDKLDEQRIFRLLEMVSHHSFGQIFITDTEGERVKKIFSQIGIEPSLFHIEKGEILN